MGIVEELYILLSAIWTGCVVALFYEILCFLRSIVIHKSWMVSCEDFFFWVFSSAYIFHQVFNTNDGNWRWYIFIGIVVGFWAIHTIWCSGKKLLLKAKKVLKNKGKSRIIR